MERSALFGTDRVVYYLQDAKKALNDMDGSRVSGIRSSTEKFLSSPKATFHKQIGPHLHQVRHLNSNTRAFATWCQDETAGRELCVVQAVYRKRNESSFFQYQDDYNSEGQKWQRRFNDLSEEEYQNWLADARTDSKIILVEEQ